MSQEDIRRGDVWEKGDERRYVRSIESRGPGLDFRYIKFNRVMRGEVVGTNKKCLVAAYREWMVGAKLIRRTDLDDGEECP